MNLFFAEHITDLGGKLEKSEAHHAQRVLRKKLGDSILVTQGKGTIYEAVISNISGSDVYFEKPSIFKKEDQVHKLHIAIAPTKTNDRFEFFIEKATELGIAEITPILCANSERKVYKADRGEKIIRSAAKQSLSCYLPVLNPMVKFDAFIQKTRKGQKFIAHCDQGKKVDFFQTTKGDESIILIGPEGDFSISEIEKAQTKGFSPISLGSKRLRTETAALAACFGFLYT
jgi:16S rRNA (uracil1498-N3)-methyltransferase